MSQDTEKQQGKPNLHEQKFIQLFCIESETLQNSINELTNETVEKKSMLLLKRSKLWKRKYKVFRHNKNLLAENMTAQQKNNMKPDWTPIKTNRKFQNS